MSISAQYVAVLKLGRLSYFYSGQLVVSEHICMNL